MCDRRQHCLGGDLHYSKESSLHSCSGSGNLGDELLEHWLCSHKRQRATECSSSSICSTSPGWGRRAKSGSGEAPGGCAALWQVVTALSGSGALLPVLAQWPQDSAEVVTPSWASRAPQGSRWHRFASPARGHGKEPGRIHGWHSRTLEQGRVSSFTA